MEIKSQHVKILVPWANRVQNGAKWCMFFITGTMNSHFFVTGVTGQIGMKFWQKNVNLCSLLNLNSRILKKFPLWGDFALKPPFLGRFNRSPYHGLRFSS